MREVFCAPAELRFAQTDAGTFEGEIEGFGSVYNTVDSHGDLLIPGAFAEAVADYRSRGVPLPMFVEHSAYLGGDPLPVGAWTEMEDTPTGLALKGRLIAKDHPEIKRVGELLQHKLLGGLSIAFPTPAESNIRRGRGPNEPRRTINKLGLVSVDLVGDPSNHKARVTALRAAGTGLSIMGDQQGATVALTDAISLCMTALAGGNSPTAQQRTALLGHLSTAHKALTGVAMPPGMESRSVATLLDFEGQLSVIAKMLGLDWSETQLRSLTAPNPGAPPARKPDTTAVRDLRAAVERFSLSL
jgi:HK97 family phage prohead protease